MLGPFATASRRTPIHQVSLSHAACASMSTTTTTTRDRGDRYGPIEWAQSHYRQSYDNTDCNDTGNTKLIKISEHGLVHQKMVRKWSEFTIKHLFSKSCHRSIRLTLSFYNKGLQMTISTSFCTPCNN